MDIVDEVMRVVVEIVKRFNFNFFGDNVIV